MKNIILASTSTVHGSGYLEYLLKDLTELFTKIDEILFIPFARPNGVSHDEYTEGVQKVFSKLSIKVTGLNSYTNKIKAIKNAKGIFVGGGNTFVLVNALYKYSLMEILKSSITGGTPYLGTSAGSNICGLYLGTSNDMPIVYPPSFETLGIVPFNINPHYLDPDPNSTHMGETRETRINEFHKFNSIPVIGLREGSFIQIKHTDHFLRGKLSARIFEQSKAPYEVDSNMNLNYLK
jgi:dipeptidase E